ncbi:DUF2963 domain-containing protein ['Prunus avium' virescence phytoplasma]|uniref:DUF2963 domain-containing protein n=1 Tax='Prunus avium' virescence phytoplasma TaxID=2056121 RepID=UPI003D804BD2
MKEFDLYNEKLIKKTYYLDDEKTINSIGKYDPSTRKIIEKTFYNNDGKTIKAICKYDPSTEKKLNTLVSELKVKK